MRSWTVIAIHNTDWKKDIQDAYSTKKIALSVARKLNREHGEEYESISIIADNGNELLDETEVYVKC